MATRCLGDGSGLSTIDGDLAAKHARNGFEVQTHSIPAQTLAPMLIDVPIRRLTPWQLR